MNSFSNPFLVPFAAMWVLVTFLVIEGLAPWVYKGKAGFAKSTCGWMDKAGCSILLTVISFPSMMAISGALSFFIPDLLAIFVGICAGNYSAIEIMRHVQSKVLSVPSSKVAFQLALINSVAVAAGMGSLVTLAALTVLAMH